MALGAAGRRDGHRIRGAVQPSRSLLRRERARSLGEQPRAGRRTQHDVDPMSSCVGRHSVAAPDQLCAAPASTAVAAAIAAAARALSRDAGSAMRTGNAWPLCHRPPRRPSHERSDHRRDRGDSKACGVTAASGLTTWGRSSPGHGAEHDPGRLPRRSCAALRPICVHVPLSPPALREVDSTTSRGPPTAKDQDRTP